MAQSIVLEASLPQGSVYGNARVVHGVATFGDGGGGSSVASTLGYIYGGSVQGKSASEGLENVTFNSNVDGDFSVGTAASGDTFYFTLFGR